MIYKFNLDSWDEFLTVLQNIDWSKHFDVWASIWKRITWVNGIFFNCPDAIVEIEIGDKMTWIQDAKKEADKRRKEQGYNEFITFSEGVTVVNLNVKKEPRDFEGQYGKRKIVEVEFEGKVYDFTMGYPTFDKLIAVAATKEVKDGFVEVQVIRAGTVVVGIGVSIGVDPDLVSPGR